jgi:hypothetical protein
MTTPEPFSRPGWQAPPPRRHHRDCDYHLDQREDECTCGASRPKAPWFDSYVAECAAAEFWAMTVRD